MLTLHDLDLIKLRCRLHTEQQLSSEINAVIDASDRHDLSQDRPSPHVCLQLVSYSIGARPQTKMGRVLHYKLLQPRRPQFDRLRQYVQRLCDDQERVIFEVSASDEFCLFLPMEWVIRHQPNTSASNYPYRLMFKLITLMRQVQPEDLTRVKRAAQSRRVKPLDAAKPYTAAVASGK
jgi:hypothetical protein